MFKNTAGEGVRIDMSRRSFLTGVAGVGAIAALGGLAGCAPSQEKADTSNAKADAASGPKTYDKVDKTYDTDLLIVGGGGSGLACAVQAALNKTNFILIEKGSELGGNASFVEGMFAIESKMAEEQGIHVTPSEIIEAELERGQHRQNGALWMDLCTKSAENIEWCLEQGVMYSGVIDEYNGGLYPTFHWFKDGKAAVGYVEPMKARLEELSVQLHLKTAVNGLVMKNGRVIGAYADGGEGVVRYSAKAVVLATGGFGGNEEIVAEQGWNTDGMRIVGSPNAAGDGYRIAMDNGACSFMADSAQSILYAIEAFPPIDFHDVAENPLYGYFGIASGGPVLWVNEACRRYTREDLANDNLALQCLPGKGNKGNYVVFDQAIFDRFFGKNDDAKKAFYDAIKANGGGSIYQSDSLADLAGRFNLDADALKAAVDRYNELCGEGADSDFGKAAGLMVPIETPPFYLAKLSYNYFFSVGGITTDGRHRVLDGRRNPIEGLYAIGNDGNMLYRNVYTVNMPGVAFGHQVNSGREAANAVLEYLDR